MLRHLASQVISGLVVTGVLVGWWLAADRDFGVMAHQAMNLVMWVGAFFQPMIEGVVNLAPESQ